MLMKITFSIHADACIFGALLHRIDRSTINHLCSTDSSGGREGGREGSFILLLHSQGNRPSLYLHAYQFTNIYIKLLPVGLGSGISL
jgi:hypothetical protein